MVDAWPATLPQFVLQSGYSEGEGDGNVEYKPDAGPTITRRRSTADMRPLSMSFELSREQKAALREFYEVTLLNGSLPFTFPAPSEDGDYLLKFQKGGAPRYASLGGNEFSASMSVWILP
jgi:hypothetical protein